MGTLYIVVSWSKSLSFISKFGSAMIVLKLYLIVNLRMLYMKALLYSYIYTYIYIYNLINDFYESSVKLMFNMRRFN